MRFLNSSLCILVTSLSGNTNASKAEQGDLSLLPRTGVSPTPDEARLSELLRRVVEQSGIPADLHTIVDRFRNLIQSAKPSMKEFTDIKNQLELKRKYIIESSPVAIVISDLLENIDAAYTDAQSSLVISEFMDSLQTRLSPEEVDILLEKTLPPLDELYPRDSASLNHRKKLVCSLAHAAKDCAETLTYLIIAAQKRIANEKEQERISRLDHIKQTLLQSGILSSSHCTAAMVSQFSSQVEALENTLGAPVHARKTEVTTPVHSLSKECKLEVEPTETDLRTFLKMKITPTIRAHLAFWAPLDNQISLDPIIETLDRFASGLKEKLDELDCPSLELTAVHAKAKRDISKYLQEYQKLRSGIVGEALKRITVANEVNWAQAKRDLEREFHRALIVDVSPETLDFAGKDSVESLRGFLGDVISAMDAIKAQEDQSKVDSKTDFKFNLVTLRKLQTSVENLLGTRARAYALVTHDSTMFRNMMEQYRDANPEILTALKTKYAQTDGRLEDMDEAINSTIDLAVTSHQTEALRIDKLYKDTREWELEVIESPTKAASVETKLNGLVLNRTGLKQRNIIQGVRARLAVFNPRLKFPADWFDPRAVQEREIKQEMVETGAQFIGRVRDMINLFSPEGVDQKQVLEAVIARMTEKSVDLIGIAMMGDNIGSVAPILRDVQTVVQDLAQRMEILPETLDPAETVEDAEEEVVDTEIPPREERVVLATNGKFGSPGLGPLFQIGLDEVEGLKFVSPDTLNRILD
jgi:hypothetical protein